MSRAKNSQIIVSGAIQKTKLSEFENDGNGDVAFPFITAPKYKVYSALLTQTGTEDPIVTILENTTGLVFTWTRTDAGLYYTNLLPGDLTKSVIFFPMMTSISNAFFRSGKTYSSKSNGTYFILDSAYDTQMDKAFIEIRLYD